MPCLVESERSALDLLLKEVLACHPRVREAEQNLQADAVFEKAVKAIHKMTTAVALGVMESFVNQHAVDEDGGERLGQVRLG